ncbi:MAG: response regulator [Candidatus Dadabacteria bacterium]|nr:MAG: response regulator [Candidatus Dadabacteria bacterium]
MKKKSGSRVTQIMNRPPTASQGSGDSVASIMRMVQNGDEARRVFMAICECAVNTPGIKGAAIYLPGEKTSGQRELVARYGDIKPLEDQHDQIAKSDKIAFQFLADRRQNSQAGDQQYIDIICLGAAIGVLAVSAPEGISDEAYHKLKMLAHHTSVVFERQRLSNTLQHFLDRLEVLNELNQLIASNVGLQRILKSLARESAFRFASDVALTFLLNEEQNALNVKGGYGCAPHLVPKEISLQTGTLAQVMRLGGHISIKNLTNHSEHGLDFLEELGIKSVDACCLEVRGESLGAILIGYRREYELPANDLTRFEEFCQGAAVAIANARTQERITAYTERLEELVESRTADLAVQTARAEEANRAKSQFLANMSHELRTPLTAIVGYGSVLADGVFGPLNEKQIDALNAITRSSDHLKKLIDDVLNLARIESGKEVAEPESIILKDILVQSHKLMQQTAIGKQVELAPLEIDSEVMEAAIYADPKHMHQVVINLMSNAVKYTPAGGKVSVSAEIVGDMAKISIIDTGVGIPPHKLKKLFERFERGEDTYSKSQEGTGIGLNLTRKLVELNGGRIGVASEVGKGSTFWIMIPLAQKAAKTLVATDNESQTFSQVRLDGLSTLVVDDNRDTCDVLRHILIAAGASVKVAHSVKEGIGELEKELPDIVLTDLAMPGESGLSLIEHIRNSESKEKELPIIVLSACAFQSDREAVFEAGASMFIPKPFKPAEVVAKVRDLTLNRAMQEGG